MSVGTTAESLETPDLTRRELYQFWVREPVRFSDTDMVGHVNNVAFAAYCESGRVSLMHLTGLPPWPESFGLVLARLELDYRREIRWPGVVEVGTRILKVGTKSVTMGQGLFTRDDCVATARSVVVGFDTAARTSRALPDDLREALIARI
jgi:acyl-CoA thioester hydrolase